MKYDVVIVASGKAIRADLGYNKVFYKMKDGRTVLDCSIDLFNEDKDCIRIIIVTNKEDFDKVSKSEKLFLVEGGELRKDSVNNGLNEVVSEYVLIHDGARPFINNETVNELKERLNNYDAICLGHMATDTVKIIDENRIVETIDRNKVFLAETPQAFKTDLLKDCYKRVNDVEFTDDASLVESLGYEVKYLINKYDNHKLTKKEDFINL